MLWKHVDWKIFVDQNYNVFNVCLKVLLFLQFGKINNITRIV